MNLGNGSRAARHLILIVALTTLIGFLTARNISFFWTSLGLGLGIWSILVYQEHNRSEKTETVLQLETSKATRFSDSWTVWTIRVSLLLFAAAIHTRLTLVLLLCICLVAAILPGKVGLVSAGSGADVWLFLLMSIVIVAAEPTGRFGVVGIASALLLFIGMRRFSGNDRAIFEAILDSAGLYLIASVTAYYLFSISSPGMDLRFGVQYASTYSFIGPSERVTFPFDIGYTTGAAVAATYLAGYLATIRIAFTPKDLFRTVAALGAIIVLVASNGRVATGVALLIGFSAYFLPQILTRYARALALTCLLVPFWWPLLVAPLDTPIQVLARSAPYFDRGSATGITSIEGRAPTWEAVLRLAPSLPWQHQLVGYGARGQIRSGAAEDYAYLWDGFVRDSTTISPHNTVLQQYLDGGVIGVGLLLIVVMLALTRLRKAGIEARGTIKRLLISGQIAMFSVLLVTGSVESSLAPGTRAGPFWLFLLISLSAASAGTKRPPEIAREQKDEPYGLMVS